MFGREKKENNNEIDLKNACVKILGGGCKKCNELEENTKSAFHQLGINISIEHITDFAKIASYGVMSTPALVINEKILIYGKVAKTTEIIKLLQKLNK